MTVDGGKDKAVLPEVARRHLSWAAGVADHPETGLLTAFVEGTLTKTHRKDLFAHLVKCSECNRLVALIAPEHEVSGVLQLLEVRRRWFASTVGRWAGVTAVAAILVCAVAIRRVYEPMKLASAPSAALKAAPPSMAAQLPGIERPGTPPSISEPSQRVARQREQTPASAVSTQQKHPQPNPVVSADANPRPNNALGKTAFQTSMVSSAASSRELKVVGVETLKPRGSDKAAWSISKAGVLQKSVDDGRTWTAVAVPTGMRLRDVAVLSQNIWTGGDHGTLYRSTDSGQTWTPVVLVSEGTPLSGDIVRIVFRDQRDGLIITRNGHIWATSDGGASWSRKYKE